MNINKVMIAGNITKPIELKKLPSGDSVVNFTLATNRTYKNKDNEKLEDTQYVDFVVFGKQADIISQYCVKGQNLYCEGRYTTRTWDKPDNTKAYKTEIVLETFQFGEKPKNKIEETKEELPLLKKTPEEIEEERLAGITVDEEGNYSDIPFN